MVVRAPARWRLGATITASGGILACAIAGWPADVYEVRMASMEPTLHCRVGSGCAGRTSDRVLVNKLAYWFSPPSRGDVVIVRLSGRNLTYCSGNGVLIKRIVAVPGERIDATRRQKADQRGVLPPGRYYVMGDSISGSCDSRTFGPVRRDEIVGRVSLIAWPVHRWGDNLHRSRGGDEFGRRKPLQLSAN